MNELPGRLTLLGHPVEHSLSPVFQNAALRHAGIPLMYEALDVAPSDLATIAGLMRDVNGAGNITVPHKVAFTALCSRCSPVAQRVGAVNTFWTDDGELVGDNTDVGGFDAAARAAFGAPRAGLVVAVLGAGGAAAAVLAAVERWGDATVRLHARGHDRAASLASTFASFAVAVPTIADAVRGAQLVVNATPVGLHGDSLPLDLALCDTRPDVFDLCYRRQETPLVIAARARGLRAVDGLGMVVEQGALAFERWFGVRPDRDLMWDAVRR